MMSANPQSWFPSTHTTSMFRLGFESLRIYPRNFQCSFVRRPKLRSAKISPQNQAPEPIPLEHACRLARTARIRTEVQVGEDQRVAAWQIHAPVLAAGCYRLINTASILVHE